MTALRRGFTLIELLIVIAILGVLAVVILLAINPQEQLARTRDAGRTSSVTQLGHAMQAYATAHDGEYVVASSATSPAGWITDLVDAGEIGNEPGGLNYAIPGTSGCGTNVQPDADGYCYVDDGNTPPFGGIVYARLESGSNNSRCVAADPATPIAWAVFDTVLGRGGIVCTTADTAEPTFNAAGQNFIN